MNSYRRSTAFSAALLVLIAVSLTGCPAKPRQQATIAKATRGTGASSSPAGSLLASVAGTLASLPDRNVTELAPPTVVLDATRSRDGQDVLATLVRMPGVENGPFNTLYVAAGNGNFRTNGIRPGDVVKYFVKYEGEYQREMQRGRRDASQISDEEFLASDIMTLNSIDLLVVDVPSENQLTLREAFPQPFDIPHRIEVWRKVDTRISEISRSLGIYANRGVPRLGWEPSPDQQALVQIVERLNQWLQQGQATVDWQATKLAEQLPEALRNDPKLSPLLSAEALERPAFSVPNDELKLLQAVPYEGRLLQEATWLRDIGRWAARGEVEALPRATKLFDWVVRNVQLDADGGDTLPRRPWQALLLGRGTATTRAWIFCGLCQQRGWSSVVLELPREGGNTIWCGVEVGDELYLFDPQLGLPIPSADDDGPITLKALRADASGLKKLDVEGAEYPTAESNFANMSAFVVADPLGLSRRAKLLERSLAGNDVLRLAVDVDAWVARLASQHSLNNAKLWPHPYQVTADQLNLDAAGRTKLALEFQPLALSPMLYKARTLHFRGRNEVVADSARGNLKDEVNDHLAATDLYINPAVRPTDAQLRQLGGTELAQAITLAKTYATYWVGLLSYDRELYESAGHWFRDTLESEQGRELWAGGASYNAARALEARELTDEAVKAYDAADEGPQAAGNRLRAARLLPTSDAAP